MNIDIKKCLIIILTAILTFSVTACKKTNSSDENSDLSSIEAVDSSSSYENSSEISARFADGVFFGDKYKININSDIWSDISAYQQGVDCAFVHNVFDGNTLFITANFNILVFEQDEQSSETADDFAKYIIDDCQNSDCIINQHENTEVNGYDAVVIDSTDNSGDFTTRTVQYIIQNDETFYCIQFYCSESVFDDMMSDFNDIISTFTIE